MRYGVEFSRVEEYDNRESAALVAAAYGGQLVVFIGQSDIALPVVEATA